MAHGFDQFITGFNMIFNRRQTETLSCQLLQTAGMSHQTAVTIDSGLSMAGSTVGASIMRSIKIPPSTPWHTVTTGIKQPKIPIRQNVSPFKNKTELELHEMFKNKGFIPRIDKSGQIRTYVNPNGTHKYYRDPKNRGRYLNEPSHVDVLRDKRYSEILQKKKFGFLDD
jgi:hypothetical protein